MRFAAPQYFFGLAVVLVLVFFAIWSARKKQRLLAVFADKKLLTGLIRNFSPRKRRYKAILFFPGVSYSRILNGPTTIWHTYGTGETGRPGHRDSNRCFQLDACRGYAPNRLERAKQEVRGLLDRLQGDRVGIVAFAGAAFVQCPLTLDYSAARLFLDIIDVD